MKQSKQPTGVKPRPGLIVSNGELDFAVHFIRRGWIYGARYLTADRYRATLGNSQLVRVPREVWDAAQPQVKEICWPFYHRRGARSEETRRRTKST